MARPVSIDWERIEPEWRSGVKSVPQLAAEYETTTGQSVTKQAINKHFKNLGVARDLSAKVQAKAKSLVAAALVAELVPTGTTLSDSVIINESATVVAQVQIAHRKDIQRFRALVSRMLDELEQASDQPELFSKLGELLDAPDDKGVDKLNELYRKVIAMPQRIDGVKKLAETLKILIGLERQAFGIADVEGKTPTTLRDVIDFIDGTTKGLPNV